VWFINDKGRAVPGARKLVREQGLLSVITSKFLGTRRAVVPIAAGAEGLSLVPFAVASAVSALLWSAALLLPGLVVCALAA
jgi:membrane protein DedA with SNARE-associated domain